MYGPLTMLLFCHDMNNIQQQQIKLFIQINKNWTSYFFLLNALKIVNCPNNFNFVRIIPVNLCEQSRSKICVNRPSQIVPGGTGFCVNRPGAAIMDTLENYVHV